SLEPITRSISSSRQKPSRNTALTTADRICGKNPLEHTPTHNKKPSDSLPLYGEGWGGGAARTALHFSTSKPFGVQFKQPARNLAAPIAFQPATAGAPTSLTTMNCRSHLRRHYFCRSSPRSAAQPARAPSTCRSTPRSFLTYLQYAVQCEC